MSNSYSSLCDEFYLDMSVNTRLELPRSRDTILTFFERIQKQYPTMCGFQRRKQGEYLLEENRSQGQYRWVSLEKKTIASGIVNPLSFEVAYSQDRFILDLIPYMLSVSHLDIDSLDITFAMDFDFYGNQDEVIAEALMGNSAFSSLVEGPENQTVSFSPDMIVGISSDYRTQARVTVESKASYLEPEKTRSDSDQVITLAFTVRQYSSGNERFDALESLSYQCGLAEQWMSEKIIPNFVQPINNVISQKRIE